MDKPILETFCLNHQTTSSVEVIPGVITLVGITSAGIFGYLSNAYQGATIGFEKQSTKLLALEERLEQLEEDKVFLKDELEAQVNDLPENYRTARRKLREDYNPQIQSVNTQILDIKGEISDLEIELVETGVDVGRAIYLAKVFGTDIDTVVKFFIFILIFVFDPMALALVISYNFMIQKEQEDELKPDKLDEIFEMYKRNTEKKNVPKRKKVTKKLITEKPKKIEIDVPVIEVDTNDNSRGGLKLNKKNKKKT